MSKIVTLIISALFFSFTTNAQDIEKGRYMLGGSVSTNNQKTEIPNRADNRSTVTQFNIAASRFYKNNRSAGINFSYFKNNNRTENFSQKNEEYGGGIFLRQYLPLGKSFFLFAEEGVGAYKSKYNTSYNNTEGNKTSFQLNIYPGIAYSIAKKIQLELSLMNLITIGHSIDKRKEIIAGENINTKNATSYFSLTSSNYSIANIGFGIRWML